MSVAASLDEGLDHEQMARAQRAHEPSMEEILASIRAIIADEREQAAPKPGPQIVYSSDAPRPAPEPIPAPTVVWSREAEEETEGLIEGLTASLADPREEAPAAVAAAPVAPEAAAPAAEVERRAPEPMPARPAARAAPLGQDKRASGASGLLSGAAERAVSQSFQSLAERMSAHGVEVAAGMAREMLQPLLKAWMDENLPAIVDRAVRSEIERLTAGWR